MTDKEVYEILNYIDEKECVVLGDSYQEIIKRFVWKGFQRSLEMLEEANLIVDETNNLSYRLTDSGKNKLNEFKVNIQNELLDKIAERNKLHNDSKLSDWQVKTFWPVLIFGLFGGLYSGYDIISKELKTEEVNEKPVSKKELEEELTKIRTLILIKDNNTKPDLKK